MRMLRRKRPPIGADGRYQYADILGSAAELFDEGASGRARISALLPPFVAATGLFRETLVDFGINPDRNDHSDDRCQKPAHSRSLCWRI